MKNEDTAVIDEKNSWSFHLSFQWWELGIFVFVLIILVYLIKNRKEQRA